MIWSARKRVIREAVTISRKLPENYSNEDVHHFDGDFTVTIKEVHIRSVSNGVVLQGFVFKNGILLSEYCLNHAVDLSHKLKAWIKFLIYPKRYLKRGVWILDNWSRGYFHWLTDALPRMLTAEEYLKEYPVIVPSNYLDEAFIYECQEIFKIEWATYDIREKLVVEDLLLTSKLKSCNFDINLISKVRERFRGHDGVSDRPQGKRKIYISRKAASRRKVINEDKLEVILVQLGFEIVIMETLNFKEQRALMADTRILISNHGAGLTNMIFMPDNSIVVELKAKARNINNCFFNLASALGHQYYYTMNESDHDNVQKANITVDLAKFENLLQSIH